jgi:hypothetical protein
MMHFKTEQSLLSNNIRKMFFFYSSLKRCEGNGIQNEVMCTPGYSKVWPMKTLCPRWGSSKQGG